ncbi:MAG: hypothetical protein U0264_02810 [Candidatus Kapaibacterium sp.]
MKQSLPYRLSVVCVFCMLGLLPGKMTLTAAEPVVKVPPMPTSTEMEVYQDSDELFAKLLLSYYQAAASLDAQLRYWEIKPVATVPVPTLDELTGQETKTIRKYYSIAMRLQTQIEALSEDQIRAHVRDVERRLLSERNKSAELSIAKYEEELTARRVDLYKQRLDNIMKFTDSLKAANDSLTYAYYMLRYSSQEAYARAVMQSSIPSIQFSNAASFLAFNNDALQTDISFGAKMELNLNSAADYGKYFDLWFAYLMPQIKSAHPSQTGQNWRQWNSNIYSFGINLNLPEVIELHPVKAGIKIGAGHYWGSGSAPNDALPETEYKGQMMNVELNFSRFTTLSPMGLYFNFGVLFPSREMNFADPVKPVSIGKNSISVFTLGVRFTIL